MLSIVKKIALRLPKNKVTAASTSGGSRIFLTGGDFINMGRFR